MLRLINSNSMKKKLFIFTFLFIVNSYCQELVFSSSIDFKSDPEIFQLIDNSKTNIAFALCNKNKVQLYKFSNSFELSDSIKIERPNKKYDKIIGYTLNSNNIQLFWSNNNKKEVLRQDVNLILKSFKTKLYNIESKKELSLFTISEQNNFINACALKNSNILKFYIINEEGSLTIKNIDFSNIDFYNSKNQKVNLYKLLSENFLPFEHSNLEKVSIDYPVPLTVSAKKKKFYIKDDLLQITFDSNTKFTQIISINLKNFTYKETKIKKTPIPKTNLILLNSNSFLKDDLVFQIKNSPEILYLTIRDYNSNIIKEYKISPDVDINFKNSKIFQFGTEMGNKYKELETSNQFLRKVSGYNIGVSCTKYNNKYFLTLGSVTAAKDNSYSYLFGASGVLINYLFNPYKVNANPYHNRKAIYLHSVLDLNGNHLEGNFSDSIFEKLKNNQNNIFSQFFIKVDSKNYFGYYNSKNKTFNISRL